MQADIFNARPYIVLSYDEWTKARAPGWTGSCLAPTDRSARCSCRRCCSCAGP